MASLTHVCMWSDNGWKPITADEAAALHPGGTVSAHSGLFMCELCGQYVLLTNGNYRARYFKHSPSEKSKDCPERTFGSGYMSTYIPGEHELPIRICDITATSFRFELGLLRVPAELIGKDLKLEIRPKGIKGKTFVYLRERLNLNGITYLSIGDLPFKKYALSIQGGDNRLQSFWPTEIRGIDPEGTLFDQVTGKMLLYDADVEIGKDYYLLRQGDLNCSEPVAGIQIQNVSRKPIENLIWNLYSVSASEFSVDAARFFLEYHCRLTEHPVSFQPVWPLYVEGDYIIKCNSQQIRLLVKGNARAIKPFPKTSVILESKPMAHPALYEVRCNSRQQLISAARFESARAKPFLYTYIWQERLDGVAQPLKITVTEISGNPVNSGEINHVPKNGILRFRSQYDGELMIYKSDQLIDRQPLSANMEAELTGVGWKTHIKLLVGLDCLWEVVFQKEQPKERSTDEAELLRYVMSASGPLIPIPHPIRNISLELRQYPKICTWIRQIAKTGVIHEQSYRRLQEIYQIAKQEKF